MHQNTAKKKIKKFVYPFFLLYMLEEFWKKKKKDFWEIRKVGLLRSWLINMGYKQILQRWLCFYTIDISRQKTTTWKKKKTRVHERRGRRLRTHWYFLIHSGVYFYEIKHCFYVFFLFYEINFVRLRPW